MGNGKVAFVGEIGTLQKDYEKQSEELSDILERTQPIRVVAGRLAETYGLMRPIKTANPMDYSVTSKGCSLFNTVVKNCELNPRYLKIPVYVFRKWGEPVIKKRDFINELKWEFAKWLIKKRDKVAKIGEISEYKNWKDDITKIKNLSVLLAYKTYEDFKKSYQDKIKEHKDNKYGKSLVCTDRNFFLQHPEFS